MKSIKEVDPINFKVAYAFAAIPARYLLENKLWHEASNLDIHPVNFPWQKFPWQKAIIHFTRVLGAVHVGNLILAQAELNNLTTLYDTLMKLKDVYKATQVQIQIKISEAWILCKQGNENGALQLMYDAAKLEDKTEKHPVTPGEVIPASELLGDMLLEIDKPVEALKAYEADLKKHPNRFNGLYGAGMACEKINHVAKARYYYQQLTTIANSPESNRPELEVARLFLKKFKNLKTRPPGLNHAKLPYPATTARTTIGFRLKAF